MIPIRRIPLKLLFIGFPKIFNATIHQISIYRADVFFAQTTDNTFSRGEGAPKGRMRNAGENITFTA
jgi:hypothetical protein